MIAAGGIFLGTAALGVATCRLAVLLVRRFELIDHPNERSSHEDPTYRGGGIGILAAAYPGAVAAALLLPGPGPEWGEVAAALGAGIPLAVLGFVDDRRGAGPFLKMTLQLAAGLLAVLVLGEVRVVALPGCELDIGALAIPLTLFWLVGFSNGYNFMDGIDGIAGLFGGVAALWIGVASLVAGGPAWLALPLAAACLSFLSVNWPPARIFMGDVGSLPVGFLLALAVVVGNRAGVPFVAGFLMLGPFLFDTIFTLFRRVARGENVLRAHRSHLYQRLLDTGLGHGPVTVLYGGWTVLSGGLGMMYVAGGAGLRSVGLAAALSTGILVVIYVRIRERASGG